MKNRKNIIILSSIAVLIVMLVGICLFVKYRTYSYVDITSIYNTNSTDNANYMQCLDGILRYSRDGVSLLLESGEEKWNQSCQMSNPMVETCGGSVAVADVGGTSILVFQKKGLKGELQTTRPIEKFAVSSQGIVSVILKDDENPLIICYDSVGNKLVEHKVSLSTMGYPIDVSLSEDGNTLLVSYLYTQDGAVTTKISYYYFGDRDTEKDEYEVYQKDFEGSIIPVTKFLNQNLSLLVSDNALVFIEGTKKPKESARVKLDHTIQSVAYSEKYVAVILQNDGSANYKLHIYNTKGKELAAVDVDKEYSYMKVCGGQILLYDGQSCSIYLKNGIHRYEGNVDQNIMEIFPVSGLHRYMVINADGFFDVRLTN